jgi:tRNA(Ile2) C34 agmatinyltransferase TiaS
VKIVKFREWQRLPIGTVYAELHKALVAKRFTPKRRLRELYQEALYNRVIDIDAHPTPEKWDVTRLARACCRFARTDDRCPRCGMQMLSRSLDGMIFQLVCPHCPTKITLPQPIHE